MGRVALHGDELTMLHPVTGEPLTIKAELPKDFAVALKYLRRYGSY
jgi:23S rRNA pseudouridine1911/1915/1917 synthase